MRQATKEMKNQMAIWPVQAHHSTTLQPARLQEQELAFFFLDIRDFTPFIASRPALQVMHAMQRLFKIFRKAIIANGGTIVETAGDGLYAVFGLNKSLAEAASSAVESGFSLLDQLEKANQRYFGPYFQHHFQVGIGLHVGKAVVGKLGLGVKNNMTVMGYSVNVAARLQEVTKTLDNNFIVSRQAYRLLHNPPMLVARQVALKGIQEKVEIYLLGNSYSASLFQKPALKVAS
ncbi:adenylate/guanylate cyclase domain-containing protein [Rhodocytophaga rosea]|uniref:Adenylate/guanylate cyclase domain-containing protein n=1 Tax=Rhodocytophaga rosea TaxID=2704465 RepID=A0A6C0GEC7_9BACT|nr:adenylate/guanylate cyclase domain-containing protein [Rhodocytophaga rosea]QHT66341.1 adenylate/guanylate cyclase domain-containing protein [Rhodocytophaga rosea]